MNKEIFLTLVYIVGLYSVRFSGGHWIMYAAVSFCYFLIMYGWFKEHDALHALDAKEVQDE